MGAHTFLVKATDTTAHTDATPASLTWTIEQTAPTVSLTAPADNAAVTGSFTLSASAADSFKMGRVEFLINGSVVGSDSTATAGSYSYLWNSTSRGDGPVTLQARAVDAAGNKTTSASRTLNMDNAPNTTITSGPTGTVTATSATFSFTATQAGSTFECSLDAGAYAACISPVSYTGLAVGAPTFTVRATDATGHVDSTPALRTWKIQ
ncbi:MAG: Ig-like domain-containing protein [Chloroflexia bacterium]